jgi:hypothetical protein
VINFYLNLKYDFVYCDRYRIFFGSEFRYDKMRSENQNTGETNHAVSGFCSKSIRAEIFGISNGNINLTAGGITEEEALSNVKSVLES